MPGSKVGDNGGQQPFPVEEGWSQENNQAIAPDKAIQDEEVVRLLLSSPAPTSNPTSSSLLLPKVRKSGQIVAASNPKRFTTTSNSVPSSTSPPPSSNNNGLSSPLRLPTTKKRLPTNLTIDRDPSSASLQAPTVIDVDNNNANALSGTRPPSELSPTTANEDTITSPGSLSFFRSFFSSTSASGNTFTFTSIDSKVKQKFSSKFGRIRKRIVYKNGDCNLHATNISKRKRRYLADIFTTLVDVKWRFTLLIFALSFILSWLLFAMIWWLIAFNHGDLEPDHLPDEQDKSGWKPCIYNFYSFASAFLFSIETQHTIGYGSRYTTEACPDAIIVMCIQSIMGVMIQALTVGIVFAKLSRPKKRTQTIVFSRHAVICQRDGDLCLMFRVGDMRKSHIISATVRAQLIKRRTTQEGEVLPYYQYNLDVTVDNNQAQVFFIWPMIVVHKINRKSPLYRVSATDLIGDKFEIVLLLEGVIETTGATTQARTSYVPSEILWGHRFEQIVSYRKEVLEYSINYGLFNRTYEVETPICSAKELEELKDIDSEVRRDGNEHPAPIRRSRASSIVAQQH